MNVGPMVTAMVLPDGTVCHHECWPTPEPDLHVSVVDVELGQVGSRVELSRRSNATAARRPCRFGSWQNALRSTDGPCARRLRPLPPPREEYVARSRPAIDPWTTVIDKWLIADQDLHRKERHTARRGWHRLVAEHDAMQSEPSLSR